MEAGVVRGHDYGVKTLSAVSAGKAMAIALWAL
jgi:hypothetical protein